METYWSEEAIRTYLLAHVDQAPSGCWLWEGPVDKRGYALFYLNGRMKRAARVAYEAFLGPIPKGFNDIHHTCENPRCICPDHLLPMTHGDHIRLHAISGVWAGERNSQAKLTEADAQFIKVAADFVSVKNLAAQFNVSERLIYKIKNGESWPHVGLPTFPRRSYAEADRAVRGAIRKSLSTFMKIRGECQERGIEEPSNLDKAITLSRLCLGC